MVIFLGVPKSLRTILGEFSSIYFVRLGLRIRVILWVMVLAIGLGCS